MKRRYFLKLCGASLLSGCAGGSFNPTDKVSSEKTVNSGLNRPTGIISVNGTFASLGSSSYVSKGHVFFDAPTYKPIEGGDPIIINFGETPKLYRIGDNTAIFEFTNENSFEDSYMFFIAGTPIPNDLVVSMVSLEDSLLLTSNSGFNKRILRIFRGNNGMQREVYFEHDDLVLANDMCLGSDGKLYLTQAPIYEGDYLCPLPLQGESQEENNPNEGRLLRPARVISIDADKNLNVEFELPSHLSPGSAGIYSTANNQLYCGNQRYWFGERIKIIEEEENFFVSDRLEQKVYRLSKKDRSVSLFQEFPEHPPMTLLKDNQGNLYIISSPLVRQDLTVIRNPKLIKINGSDMQEIHEIDLGDFSFQGFVYGITIKSIIAKPNGKPPFYPLGYSISATLEDFVDLGYTQLIYTDSHRKQVRRVIFPGGISNHLM